MIKATALLVGLVLGTAIWWWKQRDARRRLADIDAGRRCVSCDGAEMQRLDEDRVRCAVCGHVASMRALGATQLSASEIAEATRPGGGDDD